MSHNKTKILLVTFLFALSIRPAWGQAGLNQEQKLQQIDERLKQLEEKLEKLQQLTANPVSGSPASAPAETKATAEAAGSPIAIKLEELDQKFRVLERIRELESEAAATKAQETPSVQAGRDGFAFKSAKGDFQLKVGGYVHSDGRFYLDDTGNRGVNTFILRRVRPSLQGTVFKFIDFRLLPDFGEGKAVLQDAYLEIRYFSKASLRAGKFKTPFGLERLQSATDIQFVERGLPTSLVPNRDLGIQLSGDLAKKRLNYAVGVFNGTLDGGSVDGDTNDGKDYVARVFAMPFQTLRIDHALNNLGFGFAVSTGKQEGTLPSYKTPGQLAFFSYATGVSANGARTRFSPQAYYYYGRFGLLAEYVQSQQKVKKEARVKTVQNSSWQVAVSYFLTGENKSFKSGNPLKAFDPANGGWGAWELVARFGQLAVDPAVYSLGLADAAKSARRAQSWTAGINWYLNKNVKLVLDYEDTGFIGGSATGNRNRERAVLNRFQISF